MLSAYMLTVIIYVVCIYVGEIFYMRLMVNCWCTQNIISVDLWNYMKYVLLLSSPSSHTVDLVTFISMLVIGYYVFIIRSVYSGW